MTARWTANPENVDPRSTPDEFTASPRHSDRMRLSSAAVESMIWSLASAQHGVVARAQLLDVGISAHVIDRRLKTGRLRPVHRGVYLVGPLRAQHTQPMAALLACGSAAVLSHRSAAVLWELIPADDSEVELSLLRADDVVAPVQSPPVREPTTQRATHRAPHSAAQRPTQRPSQRIRRSPGSRPGIRVHRTRALRAEDVTQRQGMAVTVVARTLYDLARRSSVQDVERVLATALDRRLIDLATLRAWLDRRTHRAGATRLRALLAAEESPALLRSVAEERFLALVQRAQLPRPRCNVRVCGFEVDFYWPGERLVVEMDGYAYHASPRMFESDRRRDAMLVAAAIRVVRVTWNQIEKEPEAMLIRLGRALAR